MPMEAAPAPAVRLLLTGGETVWRVTLHLGSGGVSSGECAVSCNN